ncbi:hypothetical protein BGW36DRAFT_373530 [Talaromyces proteolyticus]|uniref:Uncharacterized protein n=1 Tax=Talaromyces proteolyticus TaxID=1131652 RepID=A0AAD4KUA9_9EURO|nr:uncharacterized protein BGW36DRAFT_373530 [Talaromyces proteolyticus]KAH8700150.1 hypothetical protein BGW36DRAFT_373530 [Talaromyces proteolyticus]
MPELCGCLGSSQSNVTTQVAADPEAGFARRVDGQVQPPRYDAVDSGYTPVVPLPRYTPRPLSIHEKTLENNFQNQNGHNQPGRGSFGALDEKNRQDFEDAPVQSHSTGSSSATVTATMDDASSAYSFPSSFGHTSTETRDTLPPPYSSCGSSMFSRSRASSLRSHYRNSISSNRPLPSEQAQQTAADIAAAAIMPPPMAHVNHAPPMFAPPAIHMHGHQRHNSTYQPQPRQSHDGR